MSLYSTVDSAFWTDTDVVDNFTPEDKYFYLYLLTSPYGNLTGCYEVSIKQISYDMGYSKETVEHLIERFVTYHKIIDYDKSTKEIIIINWWKHHWTSSDKYISALFKRISGIKSEKFRNYLTVLAKTFGESVDKNTVCIPYVYGMDTSYTYIYNNIYKDIDIDKEDKGGVGEKGEEDRGVDKTPDEAPADGEKKSRKKRTAKPFVPPTLEEVKAYAEEKGYDIDCEYFWRYYTEGDWIDGQGKPVLNWKQKLITWVRHNGGSDNGIGKNQYGGYGSGRAVNQKGKSDYSDIKPSLDPDDESTWW